MSWTPRCVSQSRIYEVTVLGTEKLERVMNPETASSNRHWEPPFTCSAMFQDVNSTR